MIDLLVAGGGPGGLATAIYAAQAGLEAVVVERRRGPIDKACGEGLMPGALAALGRLAVPTQIVLPDSESVCAPAPITVAVRPARAV